MVSLATQTDPPFPAAPASNARRERILEAARQCFAGDGFASATIIDVAKAAGVSRPLVYKYFGDKDGLIDAVLRETFDEWSTLNASFASLSGAGDTDAFERKVFAAIEFVQARPVFRSILLQDPQIVVRGHLDELRDCRSVSFASTCALVRAGVARGTYRSDLDVDAVAASLEMTLFSLLQRALGLHPELGLDPELVQTTLALTLRGLRPD